MISKELSHLRDRVACAKLAAEDDHMHADIELLAEHIVRLEIQVGNMERRLKRYEAATA
jgi:hypothetical protein